MSEHALALDNTIQAMKALVVIVAGMSVSALIAGLTAGIMLVVGKHIKDRFFHD